ncbi:MAG: SusC/RagA family TonB-linked outer membrane protein, partial [Duncaniella sp.]|nr:SusC/RagA family TonB-linked outer membrane protein [Duncaniella sp.]
QVYDAAGNLCTQNTPTNLDDIVYLGSYTPTYSGSLSTNLRWRDLTLSALLLFEGGHKMRCTDFTYSDRWHQPGDESKTDVPRYVASENPSLYCNMDLYNRSSAVIKDASNLRLRNISLTYRLPRFLCSKFYAKEARVMVGIENVATFAKSKGVKYALGGYNNPDYMMSLNLSF